jgi:hypothetical protein
MFGASVLILPGRFNSNPALEKTSAPELTRLRGFNFIRPRPGRRLEYYDLSQHLQQLAQIVFNPARIARIEMATQKDLSFNTSNARNSTATPTRMMNTPVILWHGQPHFLVSQHFFSSGVSMMDSFLG